MASGSITSWQTEGGKVRAVTDFLFLGSKTTADSDCSHEIRRCLLLRRKAVKNLNSVLKSKDITSPTNVHIVKVMIFPVVMYGWFTELIHKEGWAPKNRCFWIVVLEKTLESPLDSKEIKLVKCKGNQSWILTGRSNAEAPLLWPPDVNSWLIGKDTKAGKVWRQKEKKEAEDETVG